jgi:glycerophosphodiester phosphodiesterase 1
MAKEMDAVSRAVRNNTSSTPAVTPTPAVPSTPTPTPAEVKYVTGFIATDPIKPNISTKNLNIDFGTDGILYIGKNHYNLHGNYRNIPIYANGSDTGATMVVYNTVNNTMKTMTWDYTPTADEAIVGTFRLKYHTHEFVSCNFPFEITIDGKNPNIDPDAGDAKDYDVNVKSVNHRGWWECPENTISAYRGSAEHGFKYVETDVAFTSDDVPVLLHDKTINRTGKNPDGSPYATPNKEIKDITFEEVRKLDFGIVRDPKFKGEKIPSFEEFIKCCRNLGLHPYIELKADTQYTEAQV